MKDLADRFTKFYREWLRDDAIGAATKSFIYFATAGDFVKIGRTTNLISRLTAFQTALPFDLNVEVILVGNAPVERYIHKLLDRYNKRGEWFHNQPVQEWLNSSVITEYRKHVELDRRCDIAIEEYWRSTPEYKETVYWASHEPI